MARTFVKLLLALCLVALHACQAKAISPPQERDILITQHCTAYQKQYSQYYQFPNGGFQDGLKHWEFTELEAPSRKGGKPEVTYKVRRPGDNSTRAVYFTGNVRNSQLGRGNGGDLQRPLYLCQNVTYSLSFSLFLGKGKVHYSGSQTPYFLLQFYDPNGVNTTAPGMWNFTKAGIEDSSGEVYPLNQWASFTEPFPHAQIGYWDIYFKFFVGPGFPAVTFGLDNVILSP